MLIVKTISDLPYVPPFQIPIYWRDDQSGKLTGAMWAYIEYMADRENKPAPGPEQMKMVVEYLHYYIHAPCWDVNGFEVELAQLRQKATELKALDQVQPLQVAEWIRQALKISLDPL